MQAGILFYHKVPGALEVFHVLGLHAEQGTAFKKPRRVGATVEAAAVQDIVASAALQAAPTDVEAEAHRPGCQQALLENPASGVEWPRCQVLRRSCEAGTAYLLFAGQEKERVAQGEEAWLQSDAARAAMLRYELLYMSNIVAACLAQSF